MNLQPYPTPFSPRQLARSAASLGLQSMMGPQGRVLFNVARAGYRAVRAARTANRATTQRTASSRASGTMAVTGYGGYIRKRRAKRRKYKKPKTSATKQLSKGFVLNNEVYGKINDPDCVYVGHSTYDTVQIPYVIAAGLLRKLFKKCGFDADSPTQEIPITNIADSRNAKVKWTILAADGTATTQEYILPDNASIKSIAEVSTTGQSLSGTIGELLNGINHQQLERIGLYQIVDQTVTDQDMLKAELNLKREIIDMVVSSVMTVSNRTKGADSGGSLENEVDSQPLEGYLYSFYGGSPRIKIMGIPKLDHGTNNGIILHRAAQLGSFFNEPPVQKTFSNCKVATPLKLQPGTMKRSKLYQRWRGYLNNVLDRLRVETTNTIISGVPGKCEIVALEESLNTGSLNLITCAYQIERRWMCNFITPPMTPMLADYKTANINNLT